MLFQAAFGFQRRWEMGGCLDVLAHAADPLLPGSSPIVIAVSEEALAVSLELTLHALDLPVLIHDPARGLWTLTLGGCSTLIVDRQLLPRDPQAFFSRLRAQLWRGLAIILTEDTSSMGLSFAPSDDVAVLEKPFGSGALLAIVGRSHARAE